ncbi:ATP-binding protein [Streptomyces sp. NPDC058286]|uniref:ATP-binding protein n=1 Tax=Streptomyces sp. NPDC058286 TaxID=3346422 RepID=UPI0036EC1DE0
MHSSTGRASAIGAVRLAGVEQTHREATTRNSGRTVMEIPLPSPIAVSVERNARHVGQVRRIAAAWLRNICRMPESRIEPVLVVVSELLTNAVLHGSGHSVGYCSWAPRPGLIRIEIGGAATEDEPKLQHAAPLAESGRGLFLTDAFINDLSGEWGYCKKATTAWCDIPIQEPAPWGQP